MPSVVRCHPVRSITLERLARELKFDVFCADRLKDTKRCKKMEAEKYQSLFFGLESSFSDFQEIYSRWQVNILKQAINDFFLSFL